MNRPADAEFAVKGAIARLALFFNASADRQFSGAEIARILLVAWQGYERSQGRRFLGQDGHLGATEGA